jgi:hypothetical protein
LIKKVDVTLGGPYGRAMLARKLLILVSIAATIAVPASFTGGAQALTTHECKETEFGTAIRYADANCSVKSFEGKFRTVEVAAGWFDVYPTYTGVFGLSSKALGQNLKFECTGVTGGGKLQNIEVGGERKVEGKEFIFELSGCTVLEPAGCKMASGLKTVQLKAISEAVGETDRLKFTPASGETLATIKIEGCAAAGSHQLKGAASGEVQANAKTIEFSTSSGSSLTFGSQPATVNWLFHLATLSNSETVALERP